MSLTIDEPANPGYVNTSLVTVANFTIQRNVASFGPSTVYWEVDHSAGNDVTPLNGSVNFADGVIYGSFQISSTSDFETELSRTHTIHLVSVDGGGRISNDLISDTASLTITQNDDPISIATADLYQTDAEGQMVNISVIRGGKRYGPVDVGFNVTYVTASADDAVVTPSPNIVRFQDGEQSKSLTVSIANDDLPELNEQLSIHLTSVIGDAVLAASNIEAILIIEASDDPNGIFQFANASLNRVADEGTNVTLVVERLRGSYQRIEVYWRALYLNTSTGLTTPAVSQIDLGVVAGTIVFENHERMKSFDVIILDDGVPELEEMYVIELVNTTGGLTGGLINTDNESVTISIRENESPYGVFMIESADPVWLAEDIPLGDSSNGTGTVDIVRTAGVFNTIQAVWEILPPNVSLPSFTDLLLKGSVGSGVTMVTPRPSTSTRALGFGGSSSSLVTVPSHLHPSDIHDGSFSISLWAMFNSSVNGMMLAKASSDGSTISYGLAVIADIDQYIFRLYYLPATLNSGFSTAEVSVPHSSLSSDSWHYVVISIASTSVSFYADGSLVGQRTLVSSISSDGVGMTLTVGGLANSQYFIGSLQDVRIYGSPLTQEYISAVYSNLAANEFLYVSGEVSVAAGNSQNSFNIQTRDDSIPEQTAIYVVHLVAVSGKAQLSDSSISMDIAVLKSDSSNGVFSLSGVAPVPVDEGRNITVMVSRAVSTYGIVSVQWEVRTASSGLLASDDFDPATGSAVFYDGDTEMDFALQTVNETVPELQEGFVVTLVAVAVDDIYPSTTPTSGAWLNSSSVNANISITENDYPYGVFQLASAYPPAGIVPPVIEVPQVHVDESAGIITLYVVRAQGTVGSATVDYSTQDGTAISGGVTPDYVPTGGTLSYGDGEQVKTINVTIRDDSVPEIGKYFYINLTNPIGSDGAPVLGTGKDMVVNINPSDDAFGVFGFTVDSLSQVVREQPSGTVVPYIVSRGNKGTFGDVTVYWEVVNGGNDVTQSTGTIFFREGITSASFLVTVLNDPDPELHENFTVRLVNATNGGRIADDGTQIAILTIQANDFPYGVFTFSSGFRPLTISESAGSINIIISREFGMSGTVVVYYATADGPAGDSYATAGEDYVQTAGNVTFQPNQTIGVFSLTINEDTTPEIPEIFYVTLFNATLLSEPDIHLQNQELPMISNGSATIIISENDNAEGIFQFNSSTFTAVEGDSTAILISRTAGTYGEVSLSWRIGLLTATSADVSALEGTDIVPNGVTLYPLNVTITDDDIPEFEETFTIAITSVGASIGAPILATVTIPTNDDPHGAIVFATDSILVSVPEPESGFSSVVLNVTREGGSVGLVFVDYNVTSANGDPVSSDISFDAVSDLYFTNGLTDRSLTIRILSDDIPEVTEVFYVNLFGATGGSRVGDAGRAEIRILANDKPYGSSVSLADRNIVTTEPDDSDASQVNVTLTRIGGTLDDLIVYYTVRSAVPDALDLFLSAIDSVSPPDAQKLQEITVFVTDDRLNECAVSCVLAYTLCQSFVYNPSTSYCQLYSSTISQSGSIPQAGVSYYQAIPGQVKQYLSPSL
jgi:G-protein coupled receptor 98